MSGVTMSTEDEKENLDFVLERCVGGSSSAPSWACSPSSLWPLSSSTSKCSPPTPMLAGWPLRWRSWIQCLTRAMKDSWVMTRGWMAVWYTEWRILEPSAPRITLIEGIIDIPFFRLTRLTVYLRIQSLLLYVYVIASKVHLFRADPITCNTYICHDPARLLLSHPSIHPKDLGQDDPRLLPYR